MRKLLLLLVFLYGCSTEAPSPCIGSYRVIEVWGGDQAIVQHIPTGKYYAKGEDSMVELPNYSEPFPIEIDSITREMLNQFPFLQVFDDYTEVTADIKIFEVKDKRDNSKGEAFYRYWDNTWILRKPSKTDKGVYTFEVLK